MIEASAVLSSDIGNVRVARAFVAAALHDWRAHVDVAAVELATSEVVTNALLHARSQVGVTVRLDDDIVRVVVADDSPSLPVVRHSLPDMTSGRGMDIVAAVTDSWGVERISGGKAVWFTVTARSTGP